MQLQDNSHEYPRGWRKRHACGRGLRAASAEGLARSTEAQAGRVHRRREEARLCSLKRRIWNGDNWKQRALFSWTRDCSESASSQYLRLNFRALRLGWISMI